MTAAAHAPSPVPCPAPFHILSTVWLTLFTESAPQAFQIDYIGAVDAAANAVDGLSTTEHGWRGRERRGYPSWHDILHPIPTASTYE